MRAPGTMASMVVAAFVLAGCAAKTAPEPGSEDLSVSAGTGAGALAGLVVDDAIRPIEGALVEVAAEGVLLNATTGADGQFRFEELTPGAYLVRVSKQYYSGLEQAVVVATGIDDPELVRFQLVYEASSVPFASVYKYEGFHECGLNFLRVCSNINILTWIVLCTYGVCLGNVTTDRSLFLQPIDGIPTFLQAELVWEPSTETGRALNFYIGGGNESELQSGFASAYNFTGGESPLMLRLTNHEGESAWCRRPSADPPCPDDALNWTRIGSERHLLGQVDAGPTQEIGGCGVISPCSVGFSAQQPFTMFTTVFHGYEPPDAWRFAVDGAPPPPPA